MSEGVRLAAGCPVEHEHRFEIPLGGASSVAGIALRCPHCADSSASASPAEELTEMLAARRRTLAGLAWLPERARAEMAAAGVLARLYQGAVADVREAAERCRGQLGVDLPSALSGVRGAVSDRAQAGAVLDAVADWAAGLTARPAY